MDRYILISDLEDISEILNDNGYGGWCSTIRNVISVLEKDETKQMVETEQGWNCPSCGLKLIGKSASGYPCSLFDLPNDEIIQFCPMCGRKVELKCYGICP